METVVACPLRTPVGKEGGQLAAFEPEELGAAVVRQVLARGGVEPDAVSDLILGNYFANQGTARRVGLLGGLPIEVPGLCVNRACGSGLQAIIDAAQGVISGNGELFLAGGVESMSRAPYLLSRPERAFQRVPPQWVSGSSRDFGRPDLDLNVSMGITAENVATDFVVSRQDQDAFACESHRKAARASGDGVFRSQIIPLAPKNPRGDAAAIDADQGPRPDTSLEALAKLPPAFKKGGSVTAGNSCMRSDGAACVVVTNRDWLARLAAPGPAAFLRSWAVVGVQPRIMGMGPVPALREAVRRASLQIEEIDLLEINEAFASQVVACCRELGLDQSRLNVAGGAIALGHPIGATGGILVVKLLHNLERLGLRYGAVAMCIGGGMGIAAVFERAA